MKAGRVPLGYPEPSTSSASATMRGNRKRDTRSKMRLRSGLNRAELRLRVQRQHGCLDHGTHPTSNAWYWEPKPERRRRWDQTVDEALRLACRSVVRIWEHEAPSEAVAKVMVALGREP
jgi:DNA mismatch endonuclease (patch repair protein)